MKAIFALIVIYIGTFFVAIQGASNSPVQAAQHETAKSSVTKAIDPRKDSDIRSLLELIGEKAATPAGIDGISMAPTLRSELQEPRPFLYRESPGYGGQQCIRVGDWKAIREKLHGGPKAKAGPALIPPRLHAPIGTMTSPACILKSVRKSARRRTQNQKPSSSAA